MSEKKELLTKAMQLAPAEKAEVIDLLIKSLDEPDKEIDELWKKEAEDRIDAYEKGDLRAVSLQQVMQKYNV